MRRAGQEPFVVSRDVSAVIVPAGVEVKLRTGTVGTITQALGGSFTVYVEGNLFRIAGSDGDAIGQQPVPPPELPAEHGEREERGQRALEIEEQRPGDPAEAAEAHEHQNRSRDSAGNSQTGQQGKVAAPQGSFSRNAKASDHGLRDGEPDAGPEIEEACKDERACSVQQELRERRAGAEQRGRCEAAEGTATKRVVTPQARRPSPGRPGSLRPSARRARARRSY